MAKHDLAAGNFLIPNATFIAELVAFVIILAIIWRYILPPVQKAMHQRQEMIRQQVEDAEEAKAKLAEAQEAYKNALTEARVEAAQIRENARAEAQRTIEELRASAQEESARIVARGEEQLQRPRAALGDRHALGRARGEDHRPAAGRRQPGPRHGRRLHRRPRRP